MLRYYTMGVVALLSLAHGRQGVPLFIDTLQSPTQWLRLGQRCSAHIVLQKERGLSPAALVQQYCRSSTVAAAGVLSRSARVASLASAYQELANGGLWLCAKGMPSHQMKLTWVNI
jgi:hypothetical protein